MSLPDLDRRTFVAASAAAAAHAQSRPGPKISVMLWTLRGSIEEKLDLAAQAGCDSVELVGEHLAWSPAESVAIRKRAESLKLGMDTISAMPNWSKEPVSMVDPAQRPAMLKEVERQIGFAKDLGIPQLLLMSGNELPGRSFAEQYASMLEGCQRAGELAAKAGVTMIIEPLNNKVNHKGFFMSNCVDGLRMVKETGNPHVKLLFDVYHEQVQLGDVIRGIQAAAKDVTVFHVADNPGRHQPGTGEMNWTNIYKAIAATGYQQYVTMEYLAQGDQRQVLIQAVAEAKASLGLKG